MTVAENVGYGLKINKWPKDKIAARVHDLLEMVELEAFGDRMIDKLSGGQQQRGLCAGAQPRAEGPAWTSPSPTSTPTSGWSCARRSG